MESTRKSESGGGQVVIQLDQRLFYGIIAVIGIVAIFFVGLMLGRLTASTAQPQAAAFPQQQVPLVQQQVPLAQGQGQQLQLQQVQPGQQLPPIGQSIDPNLLRPAGDDIPIGDNPRLALPDLAATDYNWDFGEIASDKPVERVFTIKNTGTKELVIDRATSSCGCTAALLSDKEIAPGGEAQLRVAYDPRQYKDQGKVTKYVDILSNDPAAPQVRFTITAFVQEQ